MAAFSINIPDALLERVLSGIAGQYGYQAILKDAEGNETPNPQTRQQFCKSIVKKFLKEATIAHEAKAIDEQRVAAIAQANTDIAL